MCYSNVCHLNIRGFIDVAYIRDEANFWNNCLLNLKKIILLLHIIIFTFPPPPGGTAILPEYIHYYGYYYQVIVQC
jgi:hypothetical protein